MGKEIRLSGQKFNPEAALQFVQRRFYTVRHNTSETLGLFVKQPDLVSTNAPTMWPPVFLALESYGFYFCDNLLSDADAALIFKALCEFMLTTNEKVLVTEL